MTVLELSTPDPRSFDDASRPFAEAVASRYAIKRLIGRGGMGIVYLARDRRLDRLVAIKTLPPHLATDESVKQRFLREIRTAGAMSHPNVVPIHGADEVNGQVFFVMGYVDGESLAARIKGLGRLDAIEAAGVLRDVAGALAHAHTRGIIHRDIKAENILVDRTTGRAMVTDFGIARLAEAGPLTATGQLLGTVYYISPEQVAGETVDHRSDLYSLGVVGFFALTGTFPFDAELASAVLVAHVNKPAPPVQSLAPAVPAGLAMIIDRCLAKQPGRRFENAERLVEALESFLANGSPASAPAKPKLVSDTEAQAVWGRAADLQAATGIHSRDEVVPKLRNDALDAARTSGLAVADIRSAGREAGISTRHMDRALVEHGLVPSTAPAPTTSIKQPRAWWAGVPLQVVEHSEVEGEIDPSRFALLNLLREGTSQTGSTTAVSIVPGRGKTSVRITYDLKGTVAAAIAMTAAGYAVLSSFGAVFLARFFFYGPIPGLARTLGLDAFLSRPDFETMKAICAVLIYAAGIPVGHLIARMIHRQGERHARLLSEAVTANVRLAIAEDQGRTGHG